MASLGGDAPIEAKEARLDDGLLETTGEMGEVGEVGDVGRDEGHDGGRDEGRDGGRDEGRDGGREEGLEGVDVVTGRVADGRGGMFFGGVGRMEQNKKNAKE
ncbi:hypothetical protein BC937DRAFT_92575 [Endogone sp. FLAS-F59071]|nr:hypothetical protein BC937DRAFT_92575 [Endogone sp. FLAS-F59071]|eukprot:RUS23079.1 hypothetical protein BC937DRAFT_92575 [Endogone sp. FLAS-F59071]